LIECQRLDFARENVKRLHRVSLRSGKRIC
jgi:hypothetical protein